MERVHGSPFQLNYSLPRAMGEVKGIPAWDDLDCLYAAYRFAFGETPRLEGTQDGIAASQAPSA